MSFSIAALLPGAARASRASSRSRATSRDDARLRAAAPAQRSHRARVRRLRASTAPSCCSARSAKATTAAHGSAGCGARSSSATGAHHQAARAERLLRALSQQELAAKLPERLCVFGVSHLPPLYLRVLAALAARVETHLFLLSPSREYFGDVRRRSARGAPTCEPRRDGPPAVGWPRPAGARVPGPARGERAVPRGARPLRRSRHGHAAARAAVRHPAPARARGAREESTAERLPIAARRRLDRDPRVPRADARGGGAARSAHRAARGPRARAARDRGR